jgi:tetratricopeptide (TPR) repeat protein
MSVTAANDRMNEGRMSESGNSIREILRTHQRLFVSVIIAVIVFEAFAGVLKNDFISFDDAGYITNNPMVLRGLNLESVRWAFTSFIYGNWHPLTWLSHMTDMELFGLDASRHHLVNLFFHISNVLLLFLLLHRVTKTIWISIWVALFFAIHPLRVESVAWAAERKDVLSCFLGLLSILAYVSYAQKKTFLRIAATGILLLLGLMSKAILVTWPFVFLLLDFWPLHRYPWQTKYDTFDTGSGLESPNQAGIAELWLEKLPFFLLSLVFCFVAFIAQRSEQAVAGLERYPVSLRLENAVVSYVLYLYKMAYPAQLALLYPLPKEIHPIFFLFCLGLLCLATYWAVLQRTKRPYVLFGWLWYVGTLVPVIGLVQIGGQAMADRYTYIPSIGIGVVVAGLLEEMSRRRKWLRRTIVLISIVICGAFLTATWRQVGFWKNNLTLFEHTVAVTQNNYVMRIHYALALQQAGDFEETQKQCEEILRIRPDNEAAMDILGTAWLQTNQADRAIQHWQKILEKKPNTVEITLCHLGTAYARKNDYTTAETYLRRAIEANPTYMDGYVSLGEMLKKRGDIAQAVAIWEKALTHDRNDVNVLKNLSWALATSPQPEIRNPQKALIYTQQAISITQGRSAAVLDAAAAAYAACGQYDAAIQAAHRAVETARLKKQDTLAAAIGERIALYQQHKPYQE